MDGDWMDTEQAAKLGGVSGARIRQLLLDGRFPGAVRIGPERRGVWMIPRAEVEAWAKSERKAGRPRKV